MRSQGYGVDGSHNWQLLAPTDSPKGNICSRQYNVENGWKSGNPSSASRGSPCGPRSRVFTEKIWSNLLVSKLGPRRQALFCSDLSFN